MQVAPTISHRPGVIHIAKVELDPVKAPGAAIPLAPAPATDKIALVWREDGERGWRTMLERSGRPDVNDLPTHAVKAEDSSVGIR